MAMYRTSPTVPADIITYRCNGTLVYVKPADNYEQALDVAQKEFPVELGGAHARERIEFFITANMSGEKKLVRISESAWAGAVARLLRGEVIDVRLRPEFSEKEAPPVYLEVPQGETLESMSRTSRSQPSSRSHSRSRKTPSPTPSNRSHKSKGFFGIGH